jgi:hypothetical protein
MTTPNPGSPEAVKSGCTCDIEANHNGDGKPINNGTNRRWLIRLYCPVHSDFEPIDY